MNDHTPAHDTNTERRTEVEAQCIASKDLETRALDWFRGCDYPSQVVELIVSYFVESDKFSDWVTDVMDGADAA